MTASTASILPAYQSDEWRVWIAERAQRNMAFRRRIDEWMRQPDDVHRARAAELLGERDS